MIPAWKIYPSSQRRSTVYLKNVVKNPFIEVGDYTVYDDFVNDPRDFERNNVLYHYPECNHDRLRIGRFCSIACGAKFICLTIGRFLLESRLLWAYGTCRSIKARPRLCSPPLRR